MIDKYLYLIIHFQTRKNIIYEIFTFIYKKFQKIKSMIYR